MSPYHLSPLILSVMLFYPLCSLADSEISESGLENSEKQTHSTQLQNLPARNLGRVEVIAKNEVDQNQTATTISSQDIANTSSNNVAESLRFSSGVFYQPSGGQRGEPSIGIRGYGATHIGIFIDGIPIHSIYDKQTDWSQFSTFNISEISISKGFTSPEYGANTLGGAINIISTKPKEKLELHTRYGFVSNNEHQAGLSLGSRLGKMYYQLSYAYTDRDSYNLSNAFKPTDYQSKGEKLNSYYTNHTLKAKVGFEPNQDHEYSLNLIYQKGEKGGMLNANTGGNFWQWPHYDKLTLYTLGSSKFAQNLTFENRLYYDSFYNELNMLGKLNTNGSVSGNPKGVSIYDDYSLGGIFSLGYEISKDSKLKFGTNIRQDNHSSQDKPLPGSSGTNDNSKIKDLTTSVFMQYSQALGERFSFSLNGSYDRNDVLRLESVDSVAKALQGWTLQGIVYAHVSDYASLYANAGKKSRLPTMKDRFSSTWGQRVSNPNLSTESALNYELGSMLETNNIRANIAVFYNDINNMLISTAMPDNSCVAGTGCVRLENAKEGYAYGAEIGFNYDAFDERLKLGLNYSYVQRKATNPAGSSYGVDGSRILDYPNHIAQASVVYTPLHMLDCIALFSFQSKQYYSVGGKTPNAYAQNEDIFLIDIKANYRFYKSLQLSAGAYNLLDRNYYYGSGYYMAGRRFLASIEYKF